LSSAESRPSRSVSLQGIGSETVRRRVEPRGWKLQGEPILNLEGTHQMQIVTFQQGQRYAVVTIYDFVDALAAEQHAKKLRGEGLAVALDRDVILSVEVRGEAAEAEKLLELITAPELEAGRQAAVGFTRGALVSRAFAGRCSLGLVFCSSDETDSGSCVRVGRQVSCACSNGTSSYQVCRADGSGEPCQCGATDGRRRLREAAAEPVRLRARQVLRPLRVLGQWRCGRRWRKLSARWRPASLARATW
jgi:hypothetical protein